MNGASLCGGLHEGGLEEGAPLLGTPKDVFSKTLEMGVCFWGTWRGVPFLGPLREEGKFYFEEFL